LNSIPVILDGSGATAVAVIPYIHYTYELGIFDMKDGWQQRRSMRRITIEMSEM
jgi:hypothetical protein